MFFTIHSFCYNCQLIVITGLSQSKDCVNSKKILYGRYQDRVDAYNVVVCKLISILMVIFTDLFHGYTDTKVMLTAYEHLITPLFWSQRPLFLAHICVSNISEVLMFKYLANSNSWCGTLATWLHVSRVLHHICPLKVFNQ